MSGLEDAITKVAPAVGLPLKVTRAIFYVAIVAVLGFLVWKVFFAGGAAERKSQQVEQQVTSGLGKTGAESGKQAVEITVKNNTQAAGIDRETQRAIHDLLKAPGANAPVDPGLAALARRAICVRASARSLSGCQQVLGPNP